MKTRTIVFVVVLVAIAVAVFALYPTIDPLTFQYTNVLNPDRSVSVTNPDGHLYLAMAKGLLLKGFIGDSFEYFGRALGTPGGILTVLGLVYLVTLAVWIYVSWLIGSRKGKPGLGIVLGLFLGFIGLIIMLILPDDENRKEQGRLNSGEYVKCPHCAELIRQEAKVCKHCGRDVQPANA